MSVVVPTCREPIYIQEAIASLLSQSAGAPEILVVDDGSPSPTELAAAVTSVCDAKLVHQRRSGVAVALNVGIAASSGQFVGFLGDDDVWAPSKLELQLKALSDAPQALGAYSGGWYMKDDGSPFPDDAGWDEPVPFDGEAMLRGEVPLLRSATALVRRSAIDRYGAFNPSLLFAEDNDFALRLVQFGSFEAVGARLYGARRHRTNMTGQGTFLPPFSERLLRIQILAAGARGDSQAASDLKVNLRNFRRVTAEASLPRIRQALSERAPSRALEEFLYGLRAPAGMAEGVRNALTRRLDRES